MQQWVDLARVTGLQSSEDEGPPPSPVPEIQEAKVEPDSPLEASTTTWEQPAPLTLENHADAVVRQHEAEPTSTP